MIRYAPVVSVADHNTSRLGEEGKPGTLILTDKKTEVPSLV